MIPTLHRHFSNAFDTQILHYKALKLQRPLGMVGEAMCQSQQSSTYARWGGSNSQLMLADDGRYYNCVLEPERLEKRQGGTLRFDAGSGVTTNLGAEPASRSGAKKMPSGDYTAWQLI